MKVISEKQPWGYLLCAGIKDIENRTWELPEKYKGERVLIHASAKLAKHEFTWEQSSVLAQHDEKFDMHFSAIIGSVRFVECTINHPSIWAEKSEIGQDEYTNEWLKPVYNWVATDAILFDKPIINVKGRLNFWDYSAEMIECPHCTGICIHQTDDPISRFTHQCEHCGHWITESDYERVK